MAYRYVQPARHIPRYFPAPAPAPQTTGHTACTGMSAHNNGHSNMPPHLRGRSTHLANRSSRLHIGRRTMLCNGTGWRCLSCFGSGVLEADCFECIQMICRVIKNSTIPTPQATARRRGRSHESSPTKDGSGTLVASIRATFSITHSQDQYYRSW
ncbi:hypothetical protein BDQ17DRAFT_1411324 [Cyathus striatus]|nr:hypothetical protein BDQ17DRAFT_1411324 [Cyathus striatus]